MGNQDSPKPAVFYFEQIIKELIMPATGLLLAKIRKRLLHLLRGVVGCGLLASSFSNLTLSLLPNNQNRKVVAEGEAGGVLGFALVLLR